MRRSTETLLSQRLKELRAEKGITQKQLASEIGVSYGSIVDYENGRREPNSKAMAALERYFQVSGEYLRGEVDRATFLQNSAAIQDRLDGLVGLFQTFKLDFDCSSQERQMLAVSILSGVMETVTTQLLHDDGPADLDGEQFAQIFQAAFTLNSQGRTELAKRAIELTQLKQYKKYEGLQYEIMSPEELAQKIAEDKKTEADWKLLDKAQQLEKTNLKKAIAIYEVFVGDFARYPLPYLRLPIIYRRQKDYQNEVRVLKTALIVIVRDNDERNYADASKRLEKAWRLLNASHL